MDISDEPKVDKTSTVANDCDPFLVINDDNNELRYQCKLCSTKTKNIGGLKMQMKRIHAVILNTKFKKSRKDKEYEELDAANEKPKHSPLMGIIGHDNIDSMDETLLAEIENNLQYTKYIIY